MTLIKVITMYSDVFASDKNVKNVVRKPLFVSGLAVCFVGLQSEM